MEREHAALPAAAMAAPLAAGLVWSDTATGIG